MHGTKRVLVADDESLVRSVVGALLRDHGMEVLEAADGAETERLAMREVPDLVILDVKMPGVDGWECLRRLRRKGFSHPILMLTDLTDVGSCVRGLDGGADDYVGKPCDLVELLARVNALLRRARGVSRQIRMGRIKVDLDRRVTTVGEEPVRLTRTEYRLLEVLLEQRGFPATRELLLDQVWGATDRVNTHTLETHIWRLRRKLGDDATSPKWLKNLSGMGYVLECEPEPAGRS